MFVYFGSSVLGGGGVVPIVHYVILYLTFGEGTSLNENKPGSGFLFLEVGIVLKTTFLGIYFPSGCPGYILGS